MTAQLSQPASVPTGDVELPDLPASDRVDHRLRVERRHGRAYGCSIAVTDPAGNVVLPTTETAFAIDTLYAVCCPGVPGPMTLAPARTCSDQSVAKWSAASRWTRRAMTSGVGLRPRMVTVRVRNLEHGESLRSFSRRPQLPWFTAQSARPDTAQPDAFGV